MDVDVSRSFSFSRQKCVIYILVVCRVATHTHPFNSPLYGTTQVIWYQKGKTNLDFTGAKDSERQWYQLGHMQVCTSLQTDNHASTSLLKFFTGWMPFLPPNQQCQSTEGSVGLQISQQFILNSIKTTADD